MTKPRARSAAIVSSLALAFGACALAPVAAFAQQVAPTGQKVTSIVVKGNERISAETVELYLPIQVGDTVDQAKLDEAVKALARTDLFNPQSIAVTLNAGVLTVTVDENPIINSVTFEGNHALSQDKLRDEITIRPRATFTTTKVQQDVDRIVELYRQTGRISATVTPKIVELPQKRVDLVFEIVEGKKSGVEDVNFLGNQEFSDGDLSSVIATRKSGLLSFFSASNNYDPDRIEYDRQQLREFYRNRGYYDFKVISAVAELDPATSAFAVTYTLDEGKRFRFGKVSVNTELKKLDGSVLLPLVPIKSGQVFNAVQVDNAVDALTFAAGSAGFAFVDVRPRYVPNRDNNTVDVVFDIQEGPRVYINRIDIVGNTSTNDDVIRRELDVAEGDAYNRVLIDRSTQNLKNLGFFKDVTIENEDADDPDRTNLRVTVEEQPTGQLSLSAGYDSYNKVTLDASVQENNFRGRGQQVSVDIQTGEIQKQISGSFTEPRLFGRNLKGTVNAFTNKYQSTDQIDFQSASTGAGFQVEFPLASDTTFSARYTLRHDDITVQAAQCASGAVSEVLCQQQGATLDSIIGFSVALDRRNDVNSPTAGYFMQLDQDLSGAGGDVDYLKTSAQAAWYDDLTHGFVFSTIGQFGYIQGWNGDHVRVNDRFFKGGQDFRGFDTAGIGPRDTTPGGSNTALGGKMFAEGTLEMRVPTFLPDSFNVKAALFTDFGTAGILDEQDREVSPGIRDTFIKDKLALRGSSGLSVTWKSPIGPVRFDLSKVWAKEPYDQTKSFQFSTLKRF